MTSMPVLLHLTIGYAVLNKTKYTMSATYLTITFNTGVKTMNDFSYHVDEQGTMTIYTDDERVIATISDCNDQTREDLNALADDTLLDLEYIQKPYFTE